MAWSISDSRGLSSSVSLIAALIESSRADSLKFAVERSPEGFAEADEPSFCGAKRPPEENVEDLRLPKSPPPVVEVPPAMLMSAKRFDLGRWFSFIDERQERKLKPSALHLSACTSVSSSENRKHEGL